MQELDKEGFVWCSGEKLTKGYKWLRHRERTVVALGTHATDEKKVMFADIEVIEVAYPDIKIIEVDKLKEETGVNKQMKVEIGEKYYIANKGWGEVVKHGEVTEILNDEQVRIKGVPPISSGSFGASVDKLFKTKEEALTYIQKEDRKQVEKYLKEINGIHDLIQFALEHNISGCHEYGDENAREAYIQAAKKYSINLGLSELEIEGNELEEKLEDEMDFKCIKEYEADFENGDTETYSHDEIIKMLDLLNEKKQ